MGRLLLLALALAVLVCLVGAGEDFYAVLGVARGATTKDIRSAYKRMALLHHPDKNPDDPGAHDRMVALTRAFGVLKDKHSRHLYDQYGEEGLEQESKRQHQYGSATYFEKVRRVARVECLVCVASRWTLCGRPPSLSISPPPLQRSLWHVMSH